MTQKKRTVMSVVLATLISALYLTGQAMSEKLNTEFVPTRTTVSFLFFFLITFLAIFTFVFWSLGRGLACDGLRICPKSVRYGITAFILISYALWLFGFYPGFMNYDGGNQLIQVLYKEVPYDAHHPLFHTLVIGLLVKLGYSIHSVDLSLGIFLYISFQLIVSGICFSRIAIFVYERSGKIFAALTTFHFSFFPTIVIFGLSTTKDVLCYAFLSLAVLDAFKLYGEKPGEKKDWVRFSICLILSCLIRRNVVYAVVVFAVAAFFVSKEHRKMSMITCLCVIIVSSLIDKALIVCLDAVPVSFNEANSIVYQQLARTYIFDGKEAFDSDELEFLYSISSGDEGLRYYDPVMADYTKAAFGANYDLIKEYKWDLYSLWIKKGLQHPKTYIEAFLYNTYQAWYPFTITKEYTRYRYIDITKWMEDTCKKGKVWDALVWIYECKYRKVPVLRFLLSTGAWMLFMFLAWIKGIYKKDKGVIVSLLLPLLVCMTSFLGPVSDVRYYLILFYLAPLSCLLLFGKKRNGEVS